MFKVKKCKNVFSTKLKKNIQEGIHTYTFVLERLGERAVSTGTTLVLDIFNF